MFVNLLRNYIHRVIRQSDYCLKTVSINFCTQSNGVKNSLNKSLQVVQENPLDICNEDVSDYAPSLSPSFNLAAYANRSYTIQQLVKLGVDLHKIEKKGLGELILKLDFESDVKKYIQFLHDVGLPASEYGHFFTVNPLIFKEDLSNLSVRINYLESKKFLPEDIVRILSKNPKWISHSTQDIDYRLGFFQHHFSLSGDEVRHVTKRRPKLITIKLRHVEELSFTIKEEMGFTKTEAKQLLLQKPKIYSLSRKAVQQRLEYLLNTMQIPHDQIVSQSGVVIARLEKIKQRHNFLLLLKKNQYDCKKPGYISLITLVEGTDAQFCEKIQTTVQIYNKYLKSL